MWQLVRSGSGGRKHSSKQQNRVQLLASPHPSTLDYRELRTQACLQWIASLSLPFSSSLFVCFPIHNARMDRKAAVQYNPRVSVCTWVMHARVWVFSTAAVLRIQRRLEVLIQQLSKRAANKHGSRWKGYGVLVLLLICSAQLQRMRVRIKAGREGGKDTHTKANGD